MNFEEPTGEARLKNLAKAPFPWFGGKSQAAELVWSLLGDVAHYVEPFAGSLAVLLGRPHPCNRSYYSETVNDLDGFVVNAWRSIQTHPNETAEAASWPVTEADKIARQIRLLKWRQERDLEHLMGDPLWCDPVMAGWWLYAVACQIGAFAGDGPWTSDPATGRIIKMAPNRATRPKGINKNRPSLVDNGQGVNHPSLREPGVSKDIPHLSGDGRGVNHSSLKEPGIAHWSDGASVELLYHPVTMPELRRWFAHISARLRHVRIVNGDWARVCTKGAIYTLSVGKQGPAGVFLDPPYSLTERDPGLYGTDSAGISDTVRLWCLEHAPDKHLRIVLASYDDEHSQTLRDAGWQEYEWFQPGFLRGGMANTSKQGTHQQHRERLWASPQCADPAASDMPLFSAPQESEP